MATSAQRMGKKGKQQSSHAGYRSGGGGNGGGARDHHGHQTATASTVPAQPNLPGVYSNPDMAFALVNIVGCVVDVHMQSGKVYQGVLKAVSHRLSIALALAHDKSRDLSHDNTEKLMQLEFADIVSVSVLPEANPNLCKDIFKTDAEISRSNGPSASREFQPFSFEGESQPPVHLDDGSAGWNAEEMFEINRSKFNVESSYDEEMTEYTTKLDRSDTKDYLERAERAAKLAKEIECAPVSQKYKKLEDGATEEELFSAVVRYGSGFPPLPGNSATTSSIDPQPSSQLDSSQTQAETPPPSHTSSIGPRAPMATSSLSPQTFSEPRPLSSATSSSLLEPSVPREAGPSFSYTAAVMNGRTSPSNGRSNVEENSRNATCLDVEGVREGNVEVPSIQEAGSEGMSQESEVSSVCVILEATEEPADNGVNVTEGVASAVECGMMPISASEQEQLQDKSTAVETTSAGDLGVGDYHDESAGGPGSMGRSDQNGSSETEKKFVLNPNAKEFTFNPNAKEFVPLSETSSTTSQSSVLLDTPSHRHVPSSHPPSSVGKRYPRPHMRSSYNYSQDPGAYSSPYQYNQQQPPIMNRPLHQGQGLQFSPQHFQPSYPMATNFAPTQGGAINPQQVMTGPNQKFYGTDMVPGTVFTGQQQYQVPMAPQHMMQQAPHSLAAPAPLLTSVSQPGLPSSPASMVMTPAGGGAVLLMQQGMQPPNPSIYPQMMVPQVGNPAVSADMMGGQPYYQ